MNEDGCDSVCKIEPYYVCTNGTTSTPSICSYNATLSMAIGSSFKHPTKNQLTLLYDMGPIEPILALMGGSYDFSSALGFDDPDVTITRAEYDPATGKVVIDADFAASIQDKDITLTFNPPNIPQSWLVSNFSETWKVQPDNRLSASYYQQEDLDQIEELEPFVQVLVGVGMSVFFISMFLRKFIGLELAALLQLGYISLVQNKDLSSYLAWIQGWDFVFGYNRWEISTPPAEDIKTDYSVLGYKKYFFFSYNAMLVLAVVVYALGGTVLAIAKAMSARSFSRKMRLFGTAIIIEIAYALVVFNVINILTAFAIEVDEGTLVDNSYAADKFFLITAIVLVLLANGSHLLTL